MLQVPQGRLLMPVPLGSAGIHDSTA